MQAAFNTIYSRPVAKAGMPTYHGHPDYDMAKALQKVSPQAQTKAKTQATDFEAMFLNQMFSQMTSASRATVRSAIPRAPGCGARC